MLEKESKFDSWELYQVMFLERVNPYLSKYKFKEYISKYPKDYLAYQYYAYLLLSLREIEDAKEVMEYGKCLLEYNTEYQQDKNKMFYFNKAYYTNKIKILLYNEDYKGLEEALKDKDKYREDDFGDITFLCKIKNKRIDIINRDNGNNSYLFRQIIKYNEEDFLDHLKKHFNKDNNEDFVSTFNEDFPVLDIVEEFKKNKKHYNYLFPKLYTDEYYLKYDNCGKDINKKSTDYFKIICFHNTNKIITMYPTPEYKGIDAIDFNYLNKKESKVRKLSQIEKFNLKYK